jgi:RimJ/RimL family protein N-acetyltransferase
MRTQEALAFLVFHPKQKSAHALTNLFLERFVREIVSQSSKSDLWMRFFGIPNVETITGRITGRIADPYEQSRDTVIVAFENRRPVGYADIARLSEQADRAEIAMLVRSDRQRRGIGKAMMQAVIQASRKEGVKQLEAYVHPENIKMQGALQKWSRMEEMRDVTFRKTFREGEIVYTIDLGAKK